MLEDNIQNEGSATQPPPTVDWHRGNGDALPRAVVELSRPRDGWTPAAWRDRLLQLANRCQETSPERAAELRRAAELMIRPKEG